MDFFNIRVFKPVNTFIKPLTNIHGVDSPYHAARFVSLIPIKRREKPGGSEKMEIWHRFHTFLACVNEIFNFMIYNNS